MQRRPGGMDFGGVKVENVLKAVDGSGNQLAMSSLPFPMTVTAAL